MFDRTCTVFSSRAFSTQSLSLFQQTYRLFLSSEIDFSPCELKSRDQAHMIQKERKEASLCWEMYREGFNSFSKVSVWQESVFLLFSFFTLTSCLGNRDAPLFHLLVSAGSDGDLAAFRREDALVRWRSIWWRQEDDADSGKNIKIYIF